MGSKNVDLCEGLQVFLNSAFLQIKNNFLSIS